MAKELPLTVGTNAPGSRKHTISQSVHIGPVSLRVLAIASMASLMLFYLAQTTQSATKSFALQELESEKQELVEDVERLELEAQRFQSLPAIQEGLGDKAETEFEPVTNLRSAE